MKNLKFFTYFMQTYWNQMGQSVYGSVTGAIKEFNNESDLYVNGLRKDMEEAVRVKVITESASWHDAHGFWRDFDRTLDCDTAEIMLCLLRHIR